MNKREIFQITKIIIINRPHIIYKIFFKIHMNMLN
jgi:hypothetical protein